MSPDCKAWKRSFADTGEKLTLPASLKIATCLDKPERRLVPIEADYVAFKIPNRFVIGYGMDYAEHYRGVEDIRIFPSEVAGH